ncbi:MAG: hypothetical protein AAGA76_11840 [Pseudomonadota bacterium]
MIAGLCQILWGAMHGNLGGQAKHVIFQRFYAGNGARARENAVQKQVTLIGTDR